MGRASTRQNKTPYQLAREELGPFPRAGGGAAGDYPGRSASSASKASAPCRGRTRCCAWRSGIRSRRSAMPTAPAPAPSGRNMCRRSSRRSFRPSCSRCWRPSTRSTASAAASSTSRRWQHRSGRAGGFPAHPAGAGADLPDRGGPAALGGKNDGRRPH